MTPSTRRSFPGDDEPDDVPTPGTNDRYWTERRIHNHGGPWECPKCDGETTRCYRCTECGADLADVTGGEAGTGEMT